MLAALLLATAWVVVPVSTSPTPEAQTPAAAPAPSVPVLPHVDALDHELDRLRDRVADPAPAPATSRDPFQFGAAREVTRRFVAEPAVVEPPPPFVAWPSLVAILRAGSDSAPTLRAVLEDASEIVRFRSVGDTVADVVVTTITADSVTLVHSPSGQSTTLTLR